VDGESSMWFLPSGMDWSLVAADRDQLLSVLA